MNRIGYFGKLPSHGDFVKTAQAVPVLAALDDWLAQVMSALPLDPRWKINYDAMAPLHLAFVGPRRRHAIAGHLVASRDQSGRRFPWLLLRTLELRDPAAFAARCPLALGPLWSTMQVLGADAMAAADPARALQAIGDTPGEIDEAKGAELDAFMQRETIASLKSALGGRDLRRMLLALGLLLQPALKGDMAEPDNGLVLPLPRDTALRDAAAAFWLCLILPFVGRANVELALFIATLAQQPALVLGFRGASAHTLRAIIDPVYAEEQQIDVADAGWIDQQPMSRQVRTLASRLEQAGMPLTLVRELFLETFVGATP